MISGHQTSPKNSFQLCNLKIPNMWSMALNHCLDCSPNPLPVSLAHVATLTHNIASCTLPPSHIITHSLMSLPTHSGHHMSAPTCVNVMAW